MKYLGLMLMLAFSKISFGQECNITILNPEKNKVDINLIGDEGSIFTSKKVDKISIPDKSLFESELFEMKFCQRGYYLVYKVKLFISKYNENVSIGYKDIKIDKLCKYTNNVYYVHFRKDHFGQSEED